MQQMFYNGMGINNHDDILSKTDFFCIREVDLYYVSWVLKQIAFLCFKENIERLASVKKQNCYKTFCLYRMPPITILLST